MFSQRRTDLTVGVCPDRLVVGGNEQPSADLIGDLRAVVGERRAIVVLSNHFVRYAVLPWAAGLRTEQHWQALARHTFASVYGSKAAAWRILVSRGPARAARVASAIEGALLDGLYALPAVASIRPYLMSAFNARRRILGAAPDTWFVVQEPRRMTVSLIRRGAWMLVRHVQIGADWLDTVPAVLERESLRSGCREVERVAIYSADRAPSHIGRYSVEDITVHGKAADAPRQAMTLH